MTIYTAFKDKVIIVAGGASGIGEHLVRQLSAFGKTIIILDHNKKAGSQLAVELTNDITGAVIFEAIEMNDTKKVATLLNKLNKTYVLGYIIQRAAVSAGYT